MSNIIGLLVLLGWLIISFCLLFAVRLSKYDRQKFIKILSSPLMYKNTDLKTIATNSRMALNKIRQARKSIIYICITGSVAFFILWLMSWVYLKNLPKSLFVFCILTFWLAYMVIRTIEYYLKVISTRIENEIIGANDE
jgi:hypothetical protein